jgi:GAF domain-containing protein
MSALMAENGSFTPKIGSRPSTPLSSTRPSLDGFGIGRSLADEFAQYDANSEVQTLQSQLADAHQQRIQLEACKVAASQADVERRALLARLDQQQQQQQRLAAMPTVHIPLPISLLSSPLLSSLLLPHLYCLALIVLC